MTFFKLLPLLLCIFVISCQKNDSTITTPTLPIDTITPVLKLKKVYCWSGNNDTLNTADNIDTIYYNGKNQLDKVVSLHNGGFFTEVATYRIYYNDANNISSIAATGTYNGDANEFYHADYRFVYNTAGKLDSLHTHWFHFGTTTFSTFKYDNNGDLSDIYLYGHHLFSEDWFLNSHTNYFRNTNRKIDSINISTEPDVPGYNRSFKYLTVNTMDTPDKIYLLTVQLRDDPSFNFALQNNGILFLHQFVNPNDNLLSSGIEDGHGTSEAHLSPFYHTFILYSDQTIRTLIPYYYLYPNNTPQPQRTMRFEYL